MKSVRTSEQKIIIKKKNRGEREKEKHFSQHIPMCSAPPRTNPWLLHSMRHLVSSLCITQGNEWQVSLAVGQEAALWRLAAVAAVGKLCECA